MPALRSARTIDAWVREDASFTDAAHALLTAGVAAIAVLDAGRRVVGLFTEQDLIAGVVPGYVRELRHTAFAEDDLAALARVGRKAAREPVARHLSRPIILDVDTSATHAAERFLHARCGAAAVVEADRFVGMLSRAELARLLLQRAGIA